MPGYKNRQHVLHMYPHCLLRTGSYSRARMHLLLRNLCWCSMQAVRARAQGTYAGYIRVPGLCIHGRMRCHHGGAHILNACTLQPVLCAGGGVVNSQRVAHVCSVLVHTVRPPCTWILRVVRNVCVVGPVPCRCGMPDGR